MTRVRSADAERLARAPREAGVSRPSRRAGALLARGTAPEQRRARWRRTTGVALTELVAVSRSLEDAFFELTADPA